MSSLKTSLQKIYEKFAMIRLHNEYLGIRFARDRDGMHHIVLVNRFQGKDIPLAVLATRSQVEALKPINNDTLELEFKECFAEEKRYSIEDFQQTTIMLPFTAGLQVRHYAEPNKWTPGVPL